MNIAKLMGMDIKFGQVIIMKRAACIPEAHLDHRFTCKGGFGMLAHALGTEIFGVWMVNESDGRVSRDDINWPDTAKYREEHGE